MLLGDFMEKKNASYEVIKYEYRDKMSPDGGNNNRENSSIRNTRSFLGALNHLPLAEATTERLQVPRNIYVRIFM